MKSDLKDGETIGYHLFFIPEGIVFKNLQDIINKLAKDYNGPYFEPHITLLEIIKGEENEIIEKTKKLAESINQITIKLKEIESEDAYFRALYCKAEPNDKLNEFHQKALEIFNIKDENLYIPHLSLYYGNAPESVKSKMIESVSLPNDIIFTADKVYLYETKGKVEKWRTIRKFDIKP